MEDPRQANERTEHRAARNTLPNGEIALGGRPLDQAPGPATSLLLAAGRLACRLRWKIRKGEFRGAIDGKAFGCSGRRHDGSRWNR